MGDTFRKAGKLGYYIVIILVVLLMINNIISRSDKVFDIIGVRSYTILTGSMEPKIMPGDLAMVKSVDTDKVQVDDVITFKYDGNTVTHRIIEKEDKGFITKGDNNNVEDREIVSKDDVIGKVIIFIPKLGYVVAFLSKPIVIVLVLVMLGLLVLKESFFENYEEKNESNKKTTNL